MLVPARLVTALALLATLAGASLVPAQTAQAQTAQAQTAEDLRAFEGAWIYVEDLTEGKPLEWLGPPMSATFTMGVEDGAVVLVSGHGSGHRDVRVTLDGSITEVVSDGKTSRYRGAAKDGVLAYEVDFIREPGAEPDGLIQRDFRITDDGLLVRVVVRSSESLALYRHAEDIEMPAPTPAAIDDLAWLAHAWVGARGSSSIEERWSPPSGGAMLGVSRTVSRGRMTAFEYLRIVERDGGLVYVAQPGGNPPTEFVCTELSASRAVFDNPRHDYPKRIVYELSPLGNLSATIGFMKGGSPRRFAYEREDD